ncbi:MAG TPA: hypothetical protein VJJ21_00475 [Candidatus Nanoarchaeia archaeon]|nr:hypothetical protein [Candidatus Nanoarchaeia archaeon]
MEKRGALELSVNTIIIVVLGVTILIVGLAFIDTIKEKLLGTSDKVFGEIEGKFEEFNAQQLLTLKPDTLTIKTGSTEQIKVIIANIDDNDYGSVIAATESLTADVKCFFAATNSLKSRSYDIPSGKQVSIDLRVQALGNAKLGDKTCNVVISGSGISEPDTEASLAIDVVK